MLKNSILVLAIFCIILLALTFGQTAFSGLFVWISSFTGIVIRNVHELLAAIQFYVQAHGGRIALAIILTIPISVWVLRSQRQTLSRPATQRKIAIILGIFLGWLGAHRFYLGQIGWGLVFLVLAYLFIPLALLIGLIDAIRYLFMDDETFASTQLRN